MGLIPPILTNLKHMKDFKVSLFDNYKSKVPTAQISIWDWFAGSEKINRQVDIIRSTTDKDKVRDLKASLPAITPSGIFSERRADKLLEYSGLICVDIDGKDNPQITDMETLKQKLSKCNYIMYCGASVSGKGLFCLIQIVPPEQHKEHFYALQKDFLDMGIVIDKGCSDVCRLRGSSYDKKPYINPDATIYETTLERNVRMKQPIEAKPPRVPWKEEPVQSLSVSQYVPQDPDSIMQQLLQPTDLSKIKVKAEISKTQKTRKILDYVIKNQIDITLDYNDWFSICCIIYNLFGEKEGRALFHNVSQFYPNYSFEETDAVFSKCIFYDTYKYQSREIIEIAAQYGVKLTFE